MNSIFIEIELLRTFLHVISTERTRNKPYLNFRLLVCLSFGNAHRRVYRSVSGFFPESVVESTSINPRFFALFMHENVIDYLKLPSGFYSVVLLTGGRRLQFIGPVRTSFLWFVVTPRSADISFREEQIDATPRQPTRHSPTLGN